MPSRSGQLPQSIISRRIRRMREIDKSPATEQPSSSAATLIFESSEPRLLLAADPLGISAGYAFNEVSGTTTADVSGNGNTGTLVNGPTFTTAGKYGNAVALDGINDYVNLGNPTALQLTGSMTVSAWIYSSSFPVDDAAIVSKRTGAEFGFQLDTTIDKGARTIGFKLTNSSGGQMFRYGATTLQPNTWYYVTGVYNASSQTIDVYLNGQLDNGVLQGTVTASQQNSTANVTIGRRAGVTGFEFSGRIDDVRIANHALTQDQIQTDMVTPLSTPGGTDTVAPTATITAPTGGASVSGTVTIAATASDNVGVAGVQFLLDNNPLGAEDTTSPYSISWNTTTAANGTHTLVALARDVNGNTALSAPVTVSVANSSDTVAPTAAITAPTGGASVSGTVTIAATASDNVGVAGVQFLLDNNPLGAEDTTSPYSISWNTTTAANGTHTLVALARDVNGNTALSAPVTVSVANITAATPAFVQVNAATPQTNQSTVSVTYTSAQVAGDTNILAIGWNNATSNITSVTDSAGNVYQQAVPTARGNGLSQAIYYASNIKAAAAGTNTVTVTFNASTPFVDIRALEYSGLDPVNPFNVGTSASGTGTSANSGAVTTTAANALIFGAGMTTGGFSAAGTNFVSRIITSPDADIAEDRLVTTTGSYNATASLSGSAAWVMQVAAFRAAGSGGTDTVAPTAAITAPTGGASVSGTVTIAATASDNVGVAGVQFLLDNNPLGAEDTTSPYSISWNTTTAANGTHTLVARARDVNGNTALSAPVTVNVANSSDTVAPTARPSTGCPPDGRSVSGTMHDCRDRVRQCRRCRRAIPIWTTIPSVPRTRPRPTASSWNTTTAANGTHTLDVALARDVNGNTALSAPVTVSVRQFSRLLSERHPRDRLRSSDRHQVPS